MMDSPRWDRPGWQLQLRNDMWTSRRGRRDVTSPVTQGNRENSSGFRVGGWEGEKKLTVGGRMEMTKETSSVWQQMPNWRSKTVFKKYSPRYSLYSESCVDCGKTSLSSETAVGEGRSRSEGERMWVPVLDVWRSRPFPHMWWWWRRAQWPPRPQSLLFRGCPGHLLYHMFMKDRVLSPAQTDATCFCANILNPWVLSIAKGLCPD